MMMRDPKYKIGDNVWILEFDTVKNMTVCGIYKSLAADYDNQIYNFYFLEQVKGPVMREPWMKFIRRGAAKWFARNGEHIVKSYIEDSIFPTKQSLIDSL